MVKIKKNVSDKTTLSVQSRNVFGKKLRKYRIQGQLPANIFGPDFKSISIGTSYKDFIKAYKVAHETGIVYLQLDKDEIPVLIKLVQKHPVNDNILHVDFRKIDLKKKIQTEVPVKTTGVSEAVAQKGGVLLFLSETLLVEALPEDIPQEINVDIAVIKELGQEIKVNDLLRSTTFEIKTPVDKVVVSVVAHKEESVAPETTAAAPEVIGEVPAEGAAVTEEGAPESGKKPVVAKASEGKAESSAVATKPGEKKTEAKK